MITARPGPPGKPYLVVAEDVKAPFPPHPNPAYCANALLTVEAPLIDLLVLPFMIGLMTS